MVRLTVNGDQHVFEEAPSVAELLRQLSMPADAVCVEVNRAIVPRRSHPALRLEDGDEVEVLTFVGGG
jgi:sulfur carrier protein